MIRRLLWTSLLAGLVVTLAMARAQEKKSDDEKPAEPPPEPKEKIVKVDEVSGRLTKMDTKKNTITIQVTFVVPDPAAQRRIEQVRNELSSASRITNAAARSRRMSDLQAEINRQTSKVKQDHKDVALTLGDDPHVRLKSPPIEYDENGKRIKHTEAELKELKGPKNEWGYMGDTSQLKTGQSLKAYVGKKKMEKSKEKEAGGNPPFVYKIHIYTEVKK
jgi:flagellar basal body-associated protein FliL